MIGWFNMLSLFLNGCPVPLETTDKVGTRTSPLRAAKRNGSGYSNNLRTRRSVISR